jgi:hippurate hydrolase
MPALKSEALYPHLVELRRAFHREPELAFEEVRTAQMIMAELDRLGIPYEYGGKGGGVIGRLGRDPGAPTVALRADMDALPGNETTNLPFASVNAGTMHACGHDAHMTMVLGAAALLRDDPPPGNVLLVFQPAEERGGGSRVILESGALEGVRAIFGGHVTHHYRTGEIMIAPGVITAQSDRFFIKVHGRGGHGARPHEAIDAVVIASLLIIAIQTLVSRETNPVYPSVITVGRVQAGSAANVIAEEAILEGTIRTTLPEVRNHLNQGLGRMCKAFGELHNARIELHTSDGYPPVVNTARETEIARRAVHATVGASGVAAMDYPSMGAEDFSYYLQKLPGCYVRFGARLREQEYIPLHSPAFDLDENVLTIGAAFFDRVAREALAEYRR